MSRVINTGGSGKERLQLSRSIVIVIHELMRQTEINAMTRDLTSFIALALLAIARTIDKSVSAWEKRGYWLKADRFRMEWEWAERLGEKMRSAVIDENWDSAASIAVQVADKLRTTQLPKRNLKVEFWRGAWEKLSLTDIPKT